MDYAIDIKVLAGTTANFCDSIIGDDRKQMALVAIAERLEAVAETYAEAALHLKHSCVCQETEHD